jgi:U2 small nuclear ribonucleoprotein A'
MNCVQQYELDLRNNSIQRIENLGVTENQFDSIDLSDNAIATLDGFPALRRLRCLHVNNNRISRIDGEALGNSLSRLEWLILTNNAMSSFEELDAGLRNVGNTLKYLSFMDNPIAKRKEYRLFVISRCPRLKVLDFRKVSLEERETCQREFPQGMPVSDSMKEEDGRAMKSQKSKGGEDAKRTKKPTKDQLMAIKSAIASATTIEEVTRLEQALQMEQQ